MRIIAADDEILQLTKLTRTLAEVQPDAEIVSFSQPSKLMRWIDAGETADVAFLDIEMGSMTGIQIAQKIREKSPQTNIVFVTGYAKYALDDFALRASGYVTKPVTVEKIRKEMQNLRFEVSNVFARTKGDFDLFVSGVAVAFKRSKSKELLAYLIYKNGGVATRKEVAAVLFEDDYSENVQNYIAKIYGDLQKDLREAGAEDILCKGFNQYSVDTRKFSCDYYDRKENEEYDGEFFAQYEWARE